MMRNDTLVPDLIPPSSEEVLALFEQMNAVSGGMLVLSIVTVGMLARALAAPLRNETYTDAAMCLEFLEQLKLGRRPGCLLCDYEFVFEESLPPAAMVIIRPDYQALLQAPQVCGVINGVCAACANKPNLKERAVAYYDENVVRITRTIPWCDPADHDLQ